MHLTFDENELSEFIRNIVKDEIKRLQPQNEWPTQTENEKSDVLSGTDGLKHYLGCSHNKAFDIIKSKILLRREGDSNPRNPQGVQQFSRLPRSTTPASLLQFRLQI